MSYYINKNTFEVLEKEIFNGEPNMDWVEYPYDEYEPEKYSLTALDSPDTIYSLPLDHIFNGHTPIQEIIDDLSADRDRYGREYPQYDYFVYEVFVYDGDEIDDTQILQPYGCYKPTAERAKQWYKEYIETIEKRTTDTIVQYKINIQHLKDELKKAGKYLEELEK